MAGALANRRKAASPIVLINAATIAPNVILPRANAVIATTAPPQPGSAPNKLAVGTCQTPPLSMRAPTSILRKCSKPKKNNNVAATKTVT